MTGLDADEPGEVAQQVVPRVQAAAARDRLRLLVDERADERLAHRDASELGHVTRTRDMAEDVEAVRPDEARVGEAPLSRSDVHDPDETGCVSPAHVVGERPGGVVGALDERRLDQVVDGDSLAGSEIDGRLADRGRLRRHRHDVRGLRLLERDEHGHQLGDAGDRELLSRSLGRQDVPVPPVSDEIGARLHARAGS